MNKQDVLKLSSMPLQSPTYPTGPYKFFNRQYMIIQYRTDPAMIRKLLPEPLYARWRRGVGAVARPARWRRLWRLFGGGAGPFRAR